MLGERGIKKRRQRRRRILKLQAAQDKEVIVVENMESDIKVMQFDFFTLAAELHC